MSKELISPGEKMPAVDSPYTELEFGITCIDADYVKRGMACFYLIESQGEFAIVETGTQHSIGNLTSLLNQKQISFEQVRYVIPTHVHLDHAGGAGAMMELFPQAQLLIHPRGARHMIDPSRLIEGSQAVYGEEVFAQLYGDIKAIAQERVAEMADGDSVLLGSRKLLFRHTEGHARHHFCVWDEMSRGWFTGDMFGICYPWLRMREGDYLLPSTTPTQFDPEAYHRSLQILRSSNPRLMYLTHYGSVEFSGEKSALLASQVDAYCEMALSGNAKDLESSLIEYTLGRIQDFSPACDKGQARSLLAFDMQLNAQGIEHWLHTRDK
jgi:glyoxylase-like metal-dependent hydrolase (beta-lactamase superfamily II)